MGILDQRKLVVMKKGDKVRVIDKYVMMYDQVGIVKDVSSDAYLPIMVEFSSGIKYSYKENELKIIEEGFDYKNESGEVFNMIVDFAVYLTKGDPDKIKMAYVSYLNSKSKEK